MMLNDLLKATLSGVLAYARITAVYCSHVVTAKNALNVGFLVTRCPIKS